MFSIFVLCKDIYKYLFKGLVQARIPSEKASSPPEASCVKLHGTRKWMFSSCGSCLNCSATWRSLGLLTIGLQHFEDEQSSPACLWDSTLVLSKVYSAKNALFNCCGFGSNLMMRFDENRSTISPRTRQRQSKPRGSSEDGFPRSMLRLTC